MPQSSREIETVASLHLKGDRFEEFGMPAANTKEVAALDELLYQLIEMKWRAKHPDKSRIPNGLRYAYQLRINTIDEGSATPLLQRRLDSPLDPTLFESTEDQQTETFREAVEELEEILKIAADQGPLPDSIYDLPLPAIRSLGSTLLENEGLQVGYGRVSDWSTKATYTSSARRYLLEQIGQPQFKTVDYQGLVRSTNVSNGTFTFVDAASKVSATAAYDLGFHLDINGENEQTWAWVKVSGQVEFTNNSKTENFVSINSIETNQLTDEFNRLQTRLLEIKNLPTGWIDGDNGERFNSQQVDDAQKVIRAAVGTGFLPQTLSPSAEGTIVFAWIKGNQHFSIEVERDGGFYFHKSNTESLAAIDEERSTLGRQPSDLIDSWIRRSV